MTPGPTDIDVVQLLPQMTSALTSAQSVIDAIMDTIADSLNEGEQKTVETPRIQATVTKVDGDARNGTLQVTVGSSTIKIPSGLDFGSCAVIKASYHDTC